MYFTNKSGGIGPCRGLTSFEKHHCIAFFFFPFMFGSFVPLDQGTLWVHCPLPAIVCRDKCLLHFC